MSTNSPSPADRRRGKDGGTDRDVTLGAPSEDTVSRDAPAGRANSLFDLRYLIGALFTFYGIVLTIGSFFISHVKSGNVDINLWLGLGMLALGVFFLLWARIRPLHVEGPSALARAEEDT